MSHHPVALCLDRCALECLSSRELLETSLEKGRMADPSCSGARDGCLYRLVSYSSILTGVARAQDF